MVVTFQTFLEIFSDLKFSRVDLEHNNLPYEDETFDIIYSKSFIEHFYYPEKIFQEAYRVLKPEIIIITLTPEWHISISLSMKIYT